MSDATHTANADQAQRQLAEQTLAEQAVADMATNIKYLARQAKVDSDAIHSAQLDALAVTRAADRHRYARGMLASRTDWRDSNLIVAAITGALTVAGGIAELTSGTQPGLWHQAVAVMWPLMAAPTAVAALCAGWCQLGRSIHHGQVMAINHRTRRWAAAGPK